MGRKTALQELAIATRQYLVATIAQHSDIQATEPPKGVKLGVKNRYHYHSVTLYKKDLLLCTPKEDVKWTPKKIEDDFILFNEKGHHPVLLVEEITAITRTRLAERQIDFIDPGKQLHLPKLLVCMTDYGLKTTHKVHTLSPSAQHLLLYLYQSNHRPAGHTAWGELFGYSRITIHRALQELVNIRAIKTSRKGKLLQVTLCDPSAEGFIELLPRFKTPIVKTLTLAERPSILQQLASPSGHTALSQFSDILDNAIPTLAINKNDYQRNKQLIEDCLSTGHSMAACQLEIWHYSPALPRTSGKTHNDHLDKLSLYLSMKDTADERTEGALEQLINSISWHKE